MTLTSPLQAVKQGIIQRLSIIYPTLTEEELTEKSGSPEYVPEAIKELLQSGDIVVDGDQYRLKGK
ncbi:hypothetical protein [Dyadobacter sp. CY356]|uniref:hypothetical protein n=1 Tax=Dyadobacter sp. CY356 TaxID=2906442 RepID=UPI001F34818D|nr:hypothetical protein [Dyadobacter sp. CY356]MCF0055548.1 hypothetical protein [Dyadobacter sp. CY356]